MGATGRAGVTACVLAVALTVTGCTGGDSETTTSAGATGTPTALASTTTGPSDAPRQAPPQAQGPNDEDHELESPEAVPTWDEASRAEAVEVAGEAMVAFARPALDEATWWRELQPLLSPAAVVAYTGTDPAEVPATQVTGDAVLTDDSSAYLARVDVPTDVGTYAVLLVREGGGEPWLVERITPPPAVQP